MEEQHKDILRKHRVFLRRELSADRLASDLYAAEIFDEEDVDEVNAAATPHRRAEALLDILIHRGPHAFVCFYQLLQKTCRHVADKILTPYPEMTSQDDYFKAASLSCFPVNFTGRTQLCSVMSTKIKDGLKLLAINGPPGYGKSSLAVVLGHMLESEGFLVLYFILKDIKTVYDAAVLILETLHMVVSNKPVLQLQQFLRFQLKRKTILILDNTEDLQVNENKEFLQFLEEVGKFSNDVYTIVTTTQALGRLQLLPFHAQSFPLEPLNDEESQLLWTKYSPDTDQESATIHQLCKACMGIPLFLEVAASQVREGNHIMSLLNELQSSPDVLLQEEGIAIKMKVFLSRLPDDLKTTLAILAVFPAAFSSAEARFLFPHDLKTFSLYQKLTKLMDYSLLKFDKEAMTYKLHNVVQSAVSKARLDDSIYQEYNLAVVTFVQFYLRLLQEMNVQFISHENKNALQLYADNKRNILHAFSLAIEYKLERAIDVSTEVVNLLAKCMNIKEFETVYEGLADVAKEDTKRYSDCLTSLGFKLLCYHGRENANEAKKVLTEARTLQECLGQVMETEERAHCISKLGLCLAMSGEIQHGVQLIVKGILIRKRLLVRHGGDIRKMLVSGGFCDLAMALSTYNIKAAVKIWEMICLETYKKILNTHPFTATLLQYIGDAHHRLGQYEHAADYKTNALDMRKNLLTIYHLDTARSFSSLAKTLEKVGHSAEAIDMLKTTLHIQARVWASPADINCTRDDIQRIEEQTSHEEVNICCAMEGCSIDEGRDQSQQNNW